jgi:hypothetical protein
MEAYQFRKEMPIALHGLWWAFAVQIPQRAGASQDAKSRDSRYPHVKKAWREVIANWAYWTPTLIVAA